MSAQAQGDGIGWPDRYRPEDLDSMALATELRKRFDRYLARDELPRSLVLHGPPGTGKTTIARILAREVYDRRWGKLAVRWVKSAETGNVDTIRNDIIKGWMRSMLAEQKLLIFEEATGAAGLTAEAQSALKEPLEAFAESVRVIFLTNHPDKLDAAIRSRCDVIEMKRPPIEECARVLGWVLKAEGLSIPDADVQAFTRGHFYSDDGCDLRTLLSSAQHCIETDGHLPSPPPETKLALVVDDVWQRSAHAEPTDGAKLLADLADQFDKYVSLPPGGVETLALWTVFAWAHEAFSVSPILALVSPTMRAGKSTVFEILEQLLLPDDTYHPSSLTPAVLYRLKGLADVDQAHPATEPKPPKLCLLIDEADRLNPDNVLWAVLNSGHQRRSAFVHRMISTTDVGKFSSWYPKGLALIDRPRSSFPDTLRDRSIVIPMQRMKAGEQRPKLPRSRSLPELAALRDQVIEWVAANFAKLRKLAGGEEELAAKALNARARDNWHQLTCIARVAGGKWEERARRASLWLADATHEKELVVELLESIRDVFHETESDMLRSVELVSKLLTMEDRPWKERRFTPTALSKMLRPLKIRPRQLWIDQGLGEKRNKQGYRLEDFADAFARHVESPLAVTARDGDGPKRTND